MTILLVPEGAVKDAVPQRRNLASYPRAGAAVAPTGGAFVIERGTAETGTGVRRTQADTPDLKAGYYRNTVATAKAVASQSRFYYREDVSTAGLVASAPVTLSTYVRSARAQTVTVVTWENYFIGVTAVRGTVALRAGVWTRISVTLTDSYVSDAKELGIGISWEAGQVQALGAVDMTMVLIENVPDLRPYFDGSSAGWVAGSVPSWSLYPFAYTWDSTGGASRSTLNELFARGQSQTPLVETFTALRESGTLVQQPVGRRDPIAVLGTTGLRSGTLTYFARDHAEALAIEATHTLGIVRLVDTTDPLAGLSYVAIDIRTDRDPAMTPTRHWHVEVTYREVAP